MHFSTSPIELPFLGSRLDKAFKSNELAFNKRHFEFQFTNESVQESLIIMNDI